MLENGQTLWIKRLNSAKEVGVCDLENKLKQITS